MSNEIVKSGSDWKLGVSHIQTIRAGKRRVFYRTLTLVFKDKRGRALDETYTFRAVDEELNQITAVTNWTLFEAYNFHGQYQRRLSIGEHHRLDQDGFKGFLTTQGVQIELRLPTWNECLSYWKASGTSPITGAMFGGSDILVANIQTVRETTLVLLNLFYFRHWNDHHFNALRTGTIEKGLLEHVLAYKKHNRWFYGKAPFADKIDCTAIPL